VAQAAVTLFGQIIIPRDPPAFCAAKTVTWLMPSAPAALLCISENNLEHFDTDHSENDANESVPNVHDDGARELDRRNMNKRADKA
jgi:hypothetical protein